VAADKHDTGSVDMPALAAAIAAGIATIAPKPVITEGSPEYVARLRQEGFYDEFDHPVFQNGYEAAARGLPAQTRQRASNLKTGRYVGGRVTVDVDGRGAVHIRYPTKTVDERFKNLGLWTSFEDLIDKIWAEMQRPAA
jgi:hypothetical protein